MMHHRPFDLAGSDYAQMWRLLERDYAAKQDRFIWHCSRLGDWKYGLWREKKLVPSFFREHAQLWLDGFERLAGFVLSEDGDNVFFIITAPGYDYLYTEILEWTIEHWLPRYVTLKTEVHEHQEAALATLEQHGFCSLGVVATTRAYDLRARGEEAIRLPKGFCVVDMGENGDYRAKALVNKSGFEGQDQASELELLKFAYSRENPAYDPTLDFSVVTAEGLHVASCVGFNDAAQGVAEVEKVCTHSQYRRQGLAEAVIRTCMQRLRARGTGRAYITGYSAAANGLYEKLGPCAHKRWFHYELK